MTTDPGSTPPILTPDAIAAAIHVIRGCKVMIDADLAAFYGVPTKVLNQAVRRNPDRFPADFCFQLTEDEAVAMWSQIVTTSRRRLSSPPLAFTEHGVVMLSSVLRSPRATDISVAIARAFVALRQASHLQADIINRLATIERHLGEHDEALRIAFDAIKRLMAEPPTEPPERIGFDTGGS